MKRIEKVETIQVGDVIMPPKRELRLWMRRHVAEKNLPETALHLHVEAIGEKHDKRGSWLIFKTRYDQSWGSTHPFAFKALRGTLWEIITQQEAA